jgi:hypothetical protein
MRQSHAKITPGFHGARLQCDRLLIQGNRRLRITPLFGCDSFGVEFFRVLSLSLRWRRGDERKDKRARDGEVSQTKIQGQGIVLRVTAPLTHRAVSLCA